MVIKEREKYSAEEKEEAYAAVLCKSYMMQALTNEIYTSIDSYKDSGHNMWKQIEMMMRGSKVGTQLKITNCITAYEEFKIKEGESLDDVYGRLTRMLNELTKNGISKTVIEEDVLEVRDLKKKKEKEVTDPLPFVSEKKNKVKCGKQAKEVSQTSESSNENSDSFDSDSEMNEIKQKKYDEKRYEKKYEKKPEEKKLIKGVADENTKCYNCGKLGHFVVNCRKPVTRNTDYYKNKFLLSKQRDAGKALMAEDDHWLNLTDKEEESEAVAHICLMARTEKDSSDECEEENDELNEE
ncbi:uncharacterized protein LOC112504851, partial [Cynara cardunculus var. scolymus]|uniref:uncharacterized protein LOC112504851 n=1 Tax=Cynara cardunculus var. scolymus TaxID=59895 RepID=UPI000D625625